VSREEGCPARLDFRVAPWLDVKCELPPGHGGLHQSRASVDCSDVPHKDRRSIVERGFSDPVPRVLTWLTWEQDVRAALERRELSNSVTQPEESR
jgi:hypothetical protein